MQKVIEAYACDLFYVYVYVCIVLTIRT